MRNIHIQKEILLAQQDEITEHVIYKRLSQASDDTHNKEVLKHISNDELKHYNFWKAITKRDIKPKKIKVWRYILLSRILGITFGIKYMEGGEKLSQQRYKKIISHYPQARTFIFDADRHEQKLINMIDEEKLKYIGSIVLGLNDALVELTGALAGLTLAFRSTKLIAVAGFIAGIAASLSMAASEYLSTRAEGEKRNPSIAAIYTGIAYIITVLILIFPYIILTNIYLALAWTIINALIIISAFTYYISIVKAVSFKKRFIEMAGLGLSIAFFTFIIGFLIQRFLHIGI